MRRKKDYGKIIAEIIKLKEKGLSKRQALHVLRHDMGYKIRDSKYYDLAREIWEHDYVCAKEVKIRFRGSYEWKRYLITPTEYTEREVLQMIKDYDFQKETEYDEVKVETWKSRRKEDKRYILTHRRLMGIYVLIVKNTIYLSIGNLREDTEKLMLEFFDDNVRFSKTHFRFLAKVIKILDEKEEELGWW